MMRASSTVRVLLHDCNVTLDTLIEERQLTCAQKGSHDEADALALPIQGKHTESERAIVVRM